jgi:hypothetical protein
VSKPVQASNSKEAVISLHFISATDRGKVKGKVKGKMFFTLTFPLLGNGAIQWENIIWLSTVSFSRLVGRWLKFAFLLKWIEGVQCLIQNPGLLPPFSGACSHLVETFRRNVSTIDGQKGGYISGFGMRSKLYYKRPIWLRLKADVRRVEGV